MLALCYSNRSFPLKIVTKATYSHNTLINNRNKEMNSTKGDIYIEPVVVYL